MHKRKLQRNRNAITLNIPKEISEELNLKPQQVVIINIQDNKIIINKEVK